MSYFSTKIIKCVISRVCLINVLFSLISFVGRLKGAEISKWRFSDMRRCALGGFRPVEFESEVKN